MRSVEIIALIMVLVGLVKMIVLLVKPRNWLEKVVKPVYSNGKITKLVALVIAVVVLNFLREELTIVQIFAVFAFVSPIMAIGFAPYGKELTAMAQKVLQDKNMLKKSWLSIWVWLVLSVWVLRELFFK